MCWRVYACTQHIKPNIMLKPRVRESRPVQDIVLITKHLRASNASMLERRVRGVRLENLPAISLSK